MSVQIYTYPTVDIIQKSLPEMVTLDRIVENSIPEEEYHDWEPDAEVLEITPIFAGRACYQSFGNKAGRKTAKEYLGHIMDVGHLSVIEHSSVTFYIQGVSRTFSHELVRHRIASYSQLSQRFVPYDEVMPIVIHPNYFIDGDADFDEVLEYHIDIGNRALGDYKERLSFLKKKLGYETFAQKKKVREAAREVLPSCVETKIVVTMNLRSIFEMLSKRNAEGADGQIRQVAQIMQNQMEELAPNIFKRDEK